MPFVGTYVMDSIDTSNLDFRWLTDEAILKAIEDIEKAQVALWTSGGQQTTSIGGVSMQWASAEQCELGKNKLKDILRARSGEGCANKITHLMR